MKFRSNSALLLAICAAVAAGTTSYLQLHAAAQSPAAGAPAFAPRAIVDKYCVTCHNARLRTGGLLLDQADIVNVGSNAEVWEKVVRKLRADAMPPPGVPRPDRDAQTQLEAWLESALDRAAASHPNPGRATIHRLNRTEYVNVIRDLLDLDVDARSVLPGDNSNVYGFDNDADTLSISPALMERYMAAARKISRLAVGRPVGADFQEHRVHKWLAQNDRMSDDLPFGSRGGTAVPYYFPVDGEYVVKVTLHRTGNDHIIGLGAPHQLDIRVDGALIKRFTVGGDEWVKMAPPENYSSNLKADPVWEDYSHNMDRDLQVRVPVKSGRRVVGVSFVDERWSPEGIIQRQVGVSRDRNELPDGNPSVAIVTISGPFSVAGPGDSPSRRKLFVCQPSTRQEEEPCARKILTTLARRAYRRPVSADDMQPLMSFFSAGRSEGTFDDGLEFALERLFASPSFLFRVEQNSPQAAGAPQRVSDLDLASRLSFFLWSSIPDDELLDLAVAGKLRNPDVLDEQVRRMLRDARSKALVDNFVGQWLVVRNLRDVVPDSDLYVDFDENLREAFRQETELFMESQLREDRSLVELLTANYTFVNERLARHYQIPNVYGTQFRRVTFTDDHRGGLLGHGSILTVTSYPNRTSPVLRGKWLLENFLGTPPPPPPPGIPPLSENSGTRQLASVRARLEEHRKNPSCATCHARMDPLGFALENYDAVGAWRVIDETRTRIDATATLPDGTTFQGPSGLRQILLSRRQQFVETVSEKLLTYALGRKLEYYDAPAVRQVTRAAAGVDYRWSSVILEIVKSLPFQMRSSQS
jgi:mono/diheme cytochrome c family protein